MLGWKLLVSSAYLLIFLFVLSFFQALTEWVRVFPKQVTETYTSSVTFMKQLTIVAVSTISYLKNVFPEESYTVENFGGVKLRILKDTCRDELAQFVSTALAQAFEAFEKKYVSDLTTTHIYTLVCLPTLPTVFWIVA